MAKVLFRGRGFGGAPAFEPFFRTRVRAVNPTPSAALLPIYEKKEVFGHFDKRKIVIATNIAETSVTVPNIRFVVDTGRARVKRFDPSSEFDGATVRMPSSKMPYVNETVFDWLVPGLYVPRIRFFLESLSKNRRISTDSMVETAQAIAGSLIYTGEDFLESVGPCKSSDSLGLRILRIAVDAQIEVKRL